LKINTRIGIDLCPPSDYITISSSILTTLNFNTFIASIFTKKEKKMSGFEIKHAALQDLKPTRAVQY